VGNRTTVDDGGINHSEVILIKVILMDQIRIYDSAKRGHVALEEIKELMRYRHLIYQIVRRDVLTRYRRSILGVAWTMLNPLGMMVVLTIAFSQLFGRDYTYPVYALSGLVAWTFFSQTTNAVIQQNIWGGGIFKRIYIPRTAFALSAMGTGLINLVISIIPLMIVMLVTGVPIKLSLFFLLIPMLLLTFFSLGVGLLISTIAVFFPDVAEMYQIILRAWMYLTPIIYPEKILNPSALKWMFYLNPMYHLVKLYRLPIYDGTIPNMNELWLAVITSIMMLLVGWAVFSNKADEFAYRI
jgi:ABC-type polysaccharide/polyol phosphate export permease